MEKTKDANSTTPSPLLGISRASSNLCASSTKLRDSGILCRDDFDGGPISLNEIDKGLYLGKSNFLFSFAYGRKSINRYNI